MTTDDASRQREVPSYDELKRRQDAPPGSSWHVFGAEDQLGTANHLTRERAVRAAGLVKTGKVFNLDYPLNTFVPSIAGTRPATEHHIFSNNPNHRDDWVDSFYLQSTTQIDGLRHIRHPRHGFYGGVADERIDVGTPDLGIQLIADKGVVARGVLLDAQRHFAAAGSPLDLSKKSALTPRHLEEIAERQGLEFTPGDVLLIRFGWAPFYLSLPVDQRARGKGRTGNPGLIQSEEMVGWLWDHQFAMVAADNSGLECSPVETDSGWMDPAEPAPEHGPSHNGMMHRPLIALLGLLIGELWNLESLADDCADDGVYEFLLTSKPLNLTGGVGSPANAMAIK